MIFYIVRIAVRLHLNLNWIFDPVTSWKRREPLLRRYTPRRKGGAA
ncbi:hypothetical protein [Pseudogemmobacter blasticus]|nr:hypothetical protein [Fuscovulum blasticum]